jgi:hypothetical protein
MLHDRRLLNDPAAQVLLREPPAFPDAVGDIPKRRVGFGIRLHGIQSRNDVLGVECEKHRIRLEAVQARAGVAELLPILAERVLINVDPNAPAQSRNPDCPMQMGHGGGSEKGETRAPWT